jgi:hypothetical protein
MLRLPLACGLALVVGLGLGGCSFLLPTGEQDVSRRWSGFDEVKSIYDRIEPYQSDLSAVKALGFDPDKTPNLQLLNHSQVVRAVLPSRAQDHVSIPQGIQDCMQAQDQCVGYFMEPSHVDYERQGSVVLDLLGFKRTTLIKGWKFGALIVVVNDRVVYKQWNGKPKIEETESLTNPLGFLQGTGVNMKGSN